MYELKRSVIENLVSDALESPVFESFRPAHADLDCVPSPQASSFTLVNEQSSKSHRFSSMYKPTQDTFEPMTGEMCEQILEAPLLQVLEPSLEATGVGEDESMCEYARQETEDNNSEEEDEDEDSTGIHKTSPEDRSVDRYNNPSPEKAQPSSSSHTLPDSSLSSYSVHSDRSDTSAPRPAPSSDSMRSMMSRRATEMSFGSATNLPSPRDRRFALRRQAIYAEYGFHIAFPESESGSSSRQAPPSPSRSHKKGHAMGGRAASASAYVFSASTSGVAHSAWSTSTSGASIKSVAELADLTSPYPSPLPSSSGLNLAQATDKLERLSVQEDLLASSRIPFVNNLGSTRTCTLPSLKSQPLRSNASGKTERIPPSSEAPRSIIRSAFVFGSRPQTEPWAPLRVVKRDSTDPLVLCVPVSASDRSERFAIWQEDPGHHPIVEALLGEVRKAIEEWKGIGAVSAYF